MRAAIPARPVVHAAVRRVAVALVLLLLPRTARAETPTPAAVPEKTAVSGRVPSDLVGRWLVVHDARLPNGKLRAFARLWEVTAGTEHLDLRLRRAELPDELKRGLDEATGTGASWRPPADALALLVQRWNDLPATPSDHDHIENELYGADAFTDELKHDEETRGSDVAILTKEFFSGDQPVKSTIAVYGIRERAPAELAGTFVSVSVAAAPFPIPITLRGAFRAYRIGPPPARSFLARVFDVFSGCGRR